MRRPQPMEVQPSGRRPCAIVRRITRPEKGFRGLLEADRPRICANFLA